MVRVRQQFLRWCADLCGAAFPTPRCTSYKYHSINGYHSIPKTTLYIYGYHSIPNTTLYISMDTTPFSTCTPRSELVFMQPVASIKTSNAGCGTCLLFTTNSMYIISCQVLRPKVERAIDVMFSYVSRPLQCFNLQSSKCKDVCKTTQSAN